jgi:hypothetical protein
MSSSKLAEQLVVAPTTTTTASSRNSDQREVTIQNVVNGKGNTSVEKDLLAGSP